LIWEVFRQNPLWGRHRIATVLWGLDVSVVASTGDQSTFASRGQKTIYWGPLKPLEKLLLRTALAPWSYAASKLYHDAYWHPCVGTGRVKDALQAKWGNLFRSY